MLLLRFLDEYIQVVAYPLPLSFLMRRNKISKNLGKGGIFKIFFGEKKAEGGGNVKFIRRMEFCHYHFLNIMVTDIAFRIFS